MENRGQSLFWSGAGLALLTGVLVSLDPGAVCRLDSGPPSTFWSYPALCFTFWAYTPPIWLMLAATGVVAARAGWTRARAFLAMMLTIYLFIAWANDPMPHVPVLFGIGGALIMLFYLLILRVNADSLAANAPRLAGYTFLVTGFWFTCGLASRPYHELMDSSQSPIDIMTYFVLAMGAFALGEWRARERRRTGHGAVEADPQQA